MNKLTAIVAFACLLVFAQFGVAEAQHDKIPQEKSLAYKHYAEKSNRINLTLEGASLEEGLKEVARQTKAGLFYDSSLLPEGDVNLQLTDVTPHEALKSILDGTGLEAYSYGGNILLRQKEAEFDIFSIDVEKNVEVTGTVFDGSTEEPLPGANVMIDGSSQGASTDANGQFAIPNVEAGEYTLVAKFVGYQEVQKEISVSGNEPVEVDFTLQASSEDFEEVVVIGYGSTEKKDLTGSVSSVSSDDLEDTSPTSSIDQALQGKAAGVHIASESGQPGSASKVRIRGSTSLLGSNQPLYIIDGMPVSAESNIPDDGSVLNTDLLQEGLNSPIGHLNPDNIESISILKDASAAAIYGSRAANGVIMIQTKRGFADGKAQFDVGYSVTTEDVRTTEMMNADEFRDIWTEAVENSEAVDPFSQQVLDGSYFGDANTNWEEEISRNNPVSSKLDLSARGGNEQVQYSTSIGVQNQEGTFSNASNDRYSGSLNLDAQLTNRLDMGTTLNVSSSTQVSPDGSLLDRVYDFRPDLPVYDEDGSYSTSGNYNLENPVALSQARNENRTTYFTGSVFGEFDISESLLFKTDVQLTYNNGDLQSVYPGATLTGGWSSLNGAGGGFAKEGSNTSVKHVWENTLTYSKNMGEVHDVTALAGASFEGSKNEYLQASGEGFPRDAVLTNLSSASESFVISSSATQKGLISNFARVEYGFDDRYLLTVSGRADRSSQFAEDKQWGFFPTVAAAWRISNEPFFENVGFVDDLKLRASAGRTGQQDFGPYQWRTLYEANQYGGSAAIAKNQLGNSQLQWEVTNQLDVGLEFALFNNRLNGSVEYYEKNTEDLLYFFKTPGNTGFDQVRANLGDTENKGIEFQLDGDIVRTNGLVWNLSANISHNQNKLVRLNDDFFDADRGVINPPNTGSVLRVGEPLGLMFGYVSDGVIQSQRELDQLNEDAPDGIYQEAGTAPGDLRFRDLDGDGQITDADQDVIGNAQPDYTGGFTNTVAYKGLTVSAQFNFSVGNDIRWGYQSSGMNFRSTLTGENKPVEAMNRWTEENSTDQPRAVYLDPNNNSRISSHYVHDASYLRLNNLNISYQLPESWRPDFFRSAKIDLNARNLMTVTNYPGADPETSNLYDDDVSSGLDNSRYPTPRIYSIKLNIGF